MKIVIEIDTENENSMDEAKSLVDNLLGRGRKIEKLELSRLINGSLSTKSANIVKAYMRKNECAIESILDLEYYAAMGEITEGTARTEILSAVDIWKK